MSPKDVAGIVLFVSGFILLDGFLSWRLYQREPTNPNFRLGFAINRFRGKWELRVGLALAGSSAIVLLVAAIWHLV